MRRVVWSADALDAFDEIVAFIARDDPRAAERVADRIAGIIVTLAEMPVGRPGRVVGTYEMVVPGLPYIVAYALGEPPASKSTLTILRIVHTSRNWPPGIWPD